MNLQGYTVQMQYLLLRCHTIQNKCLSTFITAILIERQDLCSDLPVQMKLVFNEQEEGEEEEQDKDDA